MNRLKKVLMRTALSVGVLAVVVLSFSTYFTWSTSKKLERRLAELRGEGVPLSIADFAREPIPPETNAAVFLQRADNDLEAVQKELEAMYPKAGRPTGTVSATEAEKLDALFAAYPKLMPLLEQAADCPDYDSQPDVTLSPIAFLSPMSAQIQKHRMLSRVLQVRSRFLMAKGRFDEALANQILMLRLCRASSREPLLQSYLVTIAIQSVTVQGANEVLQAGPVSPASRQSLDAELALLDQSENLRRALQSERAFTLSMVQELTKNIFWMTGGLRNDLTLRFLDFYDRRLIDASLPYWQVITESKSSRRVPRSWNPLNTLVVLLEPAWDSTREAAERIRAISRSLRILNALQAHAINDDAPKLDDLGLPRDATIDPFNGEPLRVKKQPDGWLVYSVGKSRTDDNGMLEGKRLYGVGPIDQAQ